MVADCDSPRPQRIVESARSGDLGERPRLTRYTRARQCSLDWPERPIRLRNFLSCHTMVASRSADPSELAPLSESGHRIVSRLPSEIGVTLLVGAGLLAGLARLIERSAIHRSESPGACSGSRATPALDLAAGPVTTSSAKVALARSLRAPCRNAILGLPDPCVWWHAGVHRLRRRGATCRTRALETTMNAALHASRSARTDPNEEHRPPRRCRPA